VTFENILMEVRDQIVWVTVNRPQVLNALNHKAMDELGEAFDQVARDDGIGALILAGAGERSFVAGADIDELAQRTRAERNSRLLLSRFRVAARRRVNHRLRRAFIEKRSLKFQSR
jgi:enoyl-CoA hydratase/carnithine racemase